MQMLSSHYKRHRDHTTLFVMAPQVNCDDRMTADRHQIKEVDVPHDPTQPIPNMEALARYVKSSASQVLLFQLKQVWPRLFESALSLPHPLSVINHDFPN